MPSLSIRLKADSLTPDIRKKAKAMASPQLMRKIGTGLVSLTKRAFNDAGLRQSAWRAKIDGTPSTLKSREATLWRSIRVVSATKQRVRIGSDRIYSAIHQLGGTIYPKKGPYLIFRIGGRVIRAKSVTIPARPYFPFTSDAQMTPRAVVEVTRVVNAAWHGKAMT